MKPPTSKAIVLALVALGLCGCTTPQAVRVQPWERGNLADSIMDPNRDPVATATIAHVYYSREAAQGGGAIGGAGCGCN
jgi:hypothetical protein